jgi:HlyD family secretion protein
VFPGTVAQVRKAPTTISNVVTYETIIAVDNPEQKLFPGMTADVSILVAKRTGVLKVPNSALRYTPPEGARFEQAATGKLQPNERLVYTPGSGASTLRATVLRVGITDGVDTEVVQGASADLPVVTSTLAGGAKPSTLRPGQGPPPNP